jgi:hypothetical protein
VGGGYEISTTPENERRGAFLFLNGLKFAKNAPQAALFFYF